MRAPSATPPSPHDDCPNLEELGGRALDGGVAGESAARRGHASGAVEVALDRVVDPHPHPASAYRHHVLAGAARGGGAFEVLHRNRVLAFEPAESVGRLAGRGAVHRTEHRDLGDRRAATRSRSATGW